MMVMLVLSLFLFITYVSVSDKRGGVQSCVIVEHFQQVCVGERKGGQEIRLRLLLCLIFVGQASQLSSFFCYDRLLLFFLSYAILLNFKNG